MSSVPARSPPFGWDEGTEMLSGLLHDVGQSVATLRAASVALWQHWDRLDEPTKRDLAGTLERESRWLGRLTDDARVNLFERGDLFAVRAELELVGDVVDDAVSTVTLGGRLAVRVDPNAARALVWADRLRMAQVLRNLLSNAEKYSHDGTTVELRVSRFGDEVTLSVRDLGPPIDPDEVQSLFERGVRLESPDSDNVPGSGLGLFISRQIVEAHGGRITVDTDSRRGVTSFSVTLRCASEEEASMRSVGS
jgi:signal transduction histidine kinase